MGNPQSTDKLAKLAHLRTQFAQGLPARIAAMAASWDAVRSGPSTPQTCDELVRQAHSLAGAAGTFGYAPIGELARALEDALLRMTGGGANDTGLIARIQELVDALPSMLRAGPVDTTSGALCRVRDSDADPLAPDSKHIVLVEDDHALAHMLATQLNMLGWEVRVFDTAQAAQLALQPPYPAALVVDVILPEGPLAGLDVVRELQALAGTAVPHVVISARSDWQARLAAVRSGAAAYLVKPVDIAALAERLDLVTHRSVQPPYRVLLVDDDAMLASHYVQTLSNAGMQATAINDPAYLLDALSQQQPEIVLLDLYMPGCNGLEALRVIRQDPQYDSLPVVFLSTEVGLTMQQSALMTGAEDFLSKPIADDKLVMAVTVRAERFRALSKLIRQDSLTGLLNHITFKLRLEAEVERGRRDAQPLSVAMLDIDHFKGVNDSYGHPAGDRVIKGVAQLLGRRLRKSDIIGRYGGEEFVVAMPNTPPALAADIMDGLRASFSKMVFESSHGEFSSSFSCGVAEARPADDTASLIHAADEALYSAKHAGRNQVVRRPT